MTTTTHYCWKVWAKFEGEESPRLVDPWADPMVYEHPFNFQFDTAEEAIRVKAEDDFGPSSEEPDWVLVRIEQTVQVIL